MTKPKAKKAVARKPEEERILDEIAGLGDDEPKEEFVVPVAPVKEEKKKQKELAGRVDDEGARYLEEIDFLKWQNSVLRIKNLRHQADSLRQQAENIRLTMETQRGKALSNAGAFEVAAKNREKNNHVELLKEMGARYGVEFTDKNVVVDDETGKIGFIAPPEG